MKLIRKNEQNYVYEINLHISGGNSINRTRYVDMLVDFLDEENLNVELKTTPIQFSSRYSLNLTVSRTTKDKILNFLAGKKQFVYGCKPKLS